MSLRPERRKRRSIDAVVHAALLESNAPIGAYGLIRRILPKTGKVAPALMFRALNRLIADSRVARIETLSGYVATESEAGIELLCMACKGWHRIADAGIHRALAATCSAHGFKPSRMIVEVSGRCANCTDAQCNPAQESVSRSQRHVVTSPAPL